MRVCDFCEKQILRSEAWVPYAGGEYHDTPECLGSVQTAVAVAVETVKSHRPQGAGVKG
jgi:hypothetical protein